MIGLSLLTVQFDGGKRIAIDLRQPHTRTVTELLSTVPFDSSAHRWGDEIYFEAPFHSEIEEDARQDMELGDVAYWPDGDAIAIFFGPTPVSHGDKPRAYSPCNIIGKVVGDLSALSAVCEGSGLSVQMLEG